MNWERIDSLLATPDDDIAERVMNLENTGKLRWHTLDFIVNGEHVKSALWRHLKEVRQIFVFNEASSVKPRKENLCLKSLKMEHRQATLIEQKNSAGGSNSRSQMAHRLILSAQPRKEYLPSHLYLETKSQKFTLEGQPVPSANENTRKKPKVKNDVSATVKK